MAEQNGDTLIEVRDLKTYFRTEEGEARAVDGVSWSLKRGQTLALVGESGCGKSVTALSIMRLVPDPPGRIVGGQILFEGRDLLAVSEKEMRRVRGNRIAMIFQEPMTSLNPVYTIGNQIVEAITLHQDLRGSAAWDLAIEMLRKRKPDDKWFIPVKLEACTIPEYDFGPTGTLRDIEFVPLYQDWDAGVERIL